MNRRRFFLAPLALLPLPAAAKGSAGAVADRIVPGAFRETVILPQLDPVTRARMRALINKVRSLKPQP